MSALVSADQLADRAVGPGAPVILDVRWDVAGGADRPAYREGHLPGAVFVDLDQELSDPPGEQGRHPLPRPERFAAAMRAAGVSPNRGVVVYDAASSLAAARAWWLLRYFRHADVAVLDGGLAAWVAAGYPLERGELPVPEPGDFVARPGGMPVVGAEQVLALAADGVLIDARAEQRFRGEIEPIDSVAGHIPGARNRPTQTNGAPFRAASELRDAFAALGVRPGVPVAVYCGSGVTAAHEVLALELAGYCAALYPGSWSEWIRDPERPVARGE
ncbi:MAG TPA: sulfurtransferase [Solirubrobacteraceae bacterium]|nr:sulfurtransferase [Solirubrobacteraceae bacterium]